MERNVSGALSMLIVGLGITFMCLYGGFLLLPSWWAVIPFIFAAATTFLYSLVWHVHWAFCDPKDRDPS